MGVFWGFDYLKEGVKANAVVIQVNIMLKINTGGVSILQLLAIVLATLPLFVNKWLFCRCT